VLYSLINLSCHQNRISDSNTVSDRDRAADLVPRGSVCQRPRFIYRAYENVGSVYLLIRRLSFKHAQCHPGSCLSRFFNNTHRVLLLNLFLRLNEEKRILMKLCGSERPEICLRWWIKVNTKRERARFELSIITHNFARKLFRFSYMEKRT
jgi:hypothetical protein